MEEKYATEWPEAQGGKAVAAAGGMTFQKLLEEPGASTPQPLPDQPQSERPWVPPVFLRTWEDKWRYLAEQYEVEPEALLEALLQTAEDDRRRDLLQQAGGDQAQADLLFQQGMDRLRLQWEQRRQEEERQLSQRLNQKLAEDFYTLCRQMPDIREPEQLPDRVWQAAVQEKIPLMDAYLRFLWQEDRKARLEQSRAAQAAAASSGSLAGTPDTPKSEQNAFIRAFREAVR